ncbi:MAG: hypothetical protein CL877_04085 [Dehalococcoidales bacterium]|nr:hypothetical protein [Dehalococcoidales bacterium]
MREASNIMKERRNLRWGEMDKGEMELNQLIQHFEIFNRSEGKSPKTNKWYSDVLNLFSPLCHPFGLLCLLSPKL